MRHWHGKTDPNSQWLRCRRMEEVLKLPSSLQRISDDIPQFQLSHPVGCLSPTSASLDARGQVGTAHAGIQLRHQLGPQERRPRSHQYGKVAWLPADVFSTIKWGTWPIHRHTLGSAVLCLYVSKVNFTGLQKEAQSRSLLPGCRGRQAQRHMLEVIAEQAELSQPSDSGHQ